MRTLLASAMALSLPLLAHAADTILFDGKRLSEQVKTLSSDAFEGRGPATAGEEKTIAYVVAQMQEAGLQPGGDLKDGKRQWTQAVPLLRAEIKGTPKLSLDVGGKSETLSQGEQVAIRAATDGSTSVDVKNAPLVFVGYGVHAPERQWNDFDGVDLKGKIAIALINDPDFETGEGDFGGKAMTYYGRWTYKYEEAARQGAIGLLVVHETAPASYGWATVKNSNTNTMFDVVPTIRGVHPQIEGRISAMRQACSSRPDSISMRRKAQAQNAASAVPLKDAILGQLCSRCQGHHRTTSWRASRAQRRMKPSSTAHWDHLGVGLADASGDTIYNGAVDNATGTAALIEIGRAFAKAPRPQRSVVFLNVTAEEKGLLGSEYYSSKPLYPLARTVAVINMDALDPFGESRNFTTSGSAQSELLDALIAEGKAAGMTYVSDRHPEAGYFFRSDHFPFAKRGVPALSWGSGNDWVDGGTEAGEAAGKDYVAKRYHQPADEWDANWTFAGMVHDLPILYRLGNDLANSTRWPQWGADSEFRAIREATAAQRE
jgi:Zn-dependent M28 family amino/carboxypeptidase